MIKKNEMAGRKSSDLEYEKRINDVMDQMVNGLISTRALLRYIIGAYDVKEAQAAKDIRSAKDKLKGLYTDWEREQQKNLALERYSMLFKRNLKESDLKEARNVQQAIDKIVGNEAPVKTETNLKTDIPAFKWAEDGD
jgi:hypothetical protein